MKQIKIEQEFRNQIAQDQLTVGFLRQIGARTANV
jgi:hypothetical protein